MANITIAEAATSLSLHHRQYEKKIQQVVRTGNELEMGMRQVRAKHTHVAPNAETQDLIQAYQGEFTPKMGVQFGANENKLQRMKIDILFMPEDIDEFFDNWQCEWVEDGKPRAQWTFPRYVYQEILMPKIIENFGTLSFNGIYQAPVVGTAGVTINSVDGLRKKGNDAIDSGLLTPIATGAIGANTAVDQMESFCDAIPVAQRDMPGEIKVSKTVEKRYWRNYRALFGTGNGVAGNQNSELRVERTNKVIKGYSEMEGSDAILFTPKRNLLIGRRIGESLMPVIRWQEQDRKLKGLAEFSRFYGTGFWPNTFVNDQFATV